MPLYTFKCPTCGEKETAFRKIVDMDNIMICNSDGSDMRRIIEAAHIVKDIGSYFSPVDGKLITGRSQRREDLKRNNCREWEGFENEKKEAIKRADAADKEFDRKIERGLYDTYNNMSYCDQNILKRIF